MYYVVVHGIHMAKRRRGEGRKKYLPDKYQQTIMYNAMGKFKK